MTADDCPKCSSSWIIIRFDATRYKLRHSCGRCGYFWFREPYDATPRKPTALEEYLAGKAGNQ